MNYAKYCALALARAHANTGSAAAIAGYLGTSSKVDKAFAQFGVPTPTRPNETTEPLSRPSTAAESTPSPTPCRRQRLS